LHCVAVCCSVLQGVAVCCNGGLVWGWFQLALKNWHLASYIWVKTDLHMWQKKPTYMTKETHICDKRDWQYEILQVVPVARSNLPRKNKQFSGTFSQNLYFRLPRLSLLKQELLDGKQIHKYSTFEFESLQFNFEYLNDSFILGCVVP